MGFTLDLKVPRRSKAIVSKADPEDEDEGGRDPAP